MILPPRLIIINQDIMNIFGCKKGKACRIAKKIRERYDKPPKSIITIDEFCEYTSLKEDKVRPFLV